jgi:hypothetical protein
MNKKVTLSVGSLIALILAALLVWWLTEEG